MAMGINTADRFYAILQKSGLLAEKELADFQRAHSDLDDVNQIMRQLIKQQLLTAWQARKLQAGQHLLNLGKYKLLDRLAWGDSGRVYLAEHTQMHARVALKTLDRRQAADPHTLEMFRKEGALAAALDHPNVIHARDFDCENNYYFLVMEYVKGETLAQRVTRDGALPPEKAADFIAQAAAGLAHAHQEGVLHRSLQPVKLLLTSEGIVKILDLGAAELASPDQRLEAQKQAYRAPEVIADSAAEDERSDIYSLGAIFYFLLNGQSPPPAGTLQRGAESQKLKYRTGTPAELAQICQQMLTIDPDARIAKAAEVVEKLQAWLAEHKAASSSDKTLVERPVLKTRESASKPVDEFSLDVASQSPAVRARSAGRPRVSSANAAGPLDAPDDTEVAEVIVPWWQNKKVMAGAGAGVLILLLGVTVWLLSGSEPPQVAAAPQGETVVVQKTRRPIDKPAAPIKKEDDEFQFDFPQPDELAAQQEPGAESAPAAVPAGEPAAEPAPAAPMTAEPAPAEPMAAEPMPAAPEAPVNSGPQTPVEFHPVDILRMISTSRASFIRLEGERPSYLVGGDASSGASYEIVASTEAKLVTGICLQTLAHDNLPGKGPGLASNGDFQLVRVRLYAGDSPTLVSSDEVKLVRAEASFSAEKKPVANALNADASKTWSIAPQVGKNHWAVFRLEKPLEIDGKTWLKIELEQADKGAIGRFRIQAVTGTAPVKADQIQDKEDSPAAWNPFNQLAEQITLPVLESDTGAVTAPVALGTLAADFELSPSLLGSETAAARQSFSIKPAGSAGQWNINLHEGKGAADAGVTVAQLVHEKDQLSIRWTDQAKEKSEAGYLGNCVLQLEGAGQRRWITMRQTVDVPALEMHFDRARDTVRADIPWLPDPTAVQVQFIPPEGSFPPHEFDPASSFNLSQGSGWVKFGKEERLVHCKLTCGASSRGVNLTLEHFLQLDPALKPIPVARNTVAKLEAAVQANFQRVNLAAGQIGQMISQAKGAAKTNLENQKNALEQQVPLAQAAVEKMEQLKTLLTELSSVGHIPYRVVYKVDGVVDIELARSQPPAIEQN